MEKPFRDVPAGTGLIETMLWQPGQGVVLARRHRDRMCLAARKLGFRFDPGAFDGVLAGIEGADPLRVRAVLHSDGRLETTTASLPPPAAVWRVAIAPATLDSKDPWLRVKSTRRRLYDDMRAALPQGVDEAVFLNEKGHVCEGTITNLLVRQGDQWVTPPLSDGVLPGVMRAQLLSTGKVRVGSVTPDDLRTAMGLRMCNALRGQIEAELVNWPG
ncbi:aminotransferase class IV family protein [Mameliella alba]|uniref:aminotransferase class IV family protein n=1 Tax=Mameliella alba TaxID=561184 RepID=UPI0010549E79|nr:aminotransferase class IV family protein [Mameliella alba]MBY6119106.1 aminotransferase class IV family protein [Mameliella alba]